MARYCPLLGQFCDIAGHKIIRREENFGRTIIAIWNRGCSLSCFARKNPTLDFTLHQIAWNTDKHWGCEWWRVSSTLHHSSPLFTWCKRINAEPLTYHEARSSLMTSAGLQWWLKQGAGNDLGASKNTGWREVKSGEECIATLHPCKPLIYSWLCRICEEWRVFLKVALYSSNAAKLLREMWGLGQKLLRKMWVFNIKLLCKMW